MVIKVNNPWNLAQLCTCTVKDQIIIDRIERTLQNVSTVGLKVQIKHEKMKLYEFNSQPRQSISKPSLKHTINDTKPELQFGQWLYLTKQPFKGNKRDYMPHAHIQSSKVISPIQSNPPIPPLLGLQKNCSSQKQQWRESHIWPKETYNLGLENKWRY